MRVVASEDTNAVRRNWVSMFLVWGPHVAGMLRLG
jgi:hypothetical protein